MSTLHDLNDFFADQHLVRDQRASLHSGDVSHFHSLRALHRHKAGLVRYYYVLVANLHDVLHNALCAGRVGLLIQLIPGNDARPRNSITRASSEAQAQLQKYY
jgi:hypothetical protein